MKTEREMFVKKYREVFKVDKSLFVNDNGEFIDEFCQSVYEIWQARVPEGYVVVPVDLADEIEDKIWDNLSSNHTITNQEGDGFIPVEDIDLGGIYKAMIEAVENEK